MGPFRGEEHRTAGTITGGNRSGRGVLPRRNGDRDQGEAHLSSQLWINISYVFDRVEPGAPAGVAGIRTRVRPARRRAAPVLAGGAGAACRAAEPFWVSAEAVTALTGVPFLALLGSTRPSR
ncbi:hypothetical protein KIF24_14585 [Micromonospora sp. Llam7]|uniref:hypothetical protein n=1 Tax=Micromonospora tarapacensis TaxID=2835305 RepID=UPI001C83BE9E|nr:hypothetical protein [Micromonospora tarapacensis]MBX7267120.1 hypothetical protein [Micromonospora tarapacensis]